MTPKSGKAGTAVAPAEPKAAEEADKADPGEVAEVKARQREQKAGKYGAEKVKPFKPPTKEEIKEKKLVWIEIQMVDEEGQPVTGEKYKIELFGYHRFGANFYPFLAGTPVEYVAEGNSIAFPIFRRRERK